MSGSAFQVRGRDQYHDRGVRKFNDCKSASDAAREYLQAYVEDWRGGWVERLLLSLRVWRDGEPEGQSIPFSSEARFRRNSQGDVAVTYMVKQEDDNASNQ